MSHRDYLKLKNLTIPLLCLLFIAKANAQRQNVYFFNKDNKVASRDSADMIRVVSEPDAGTTLYNVQEFYKNGTIKFQGKSSTIDPLLLEGQAIDYYPSGKRRSLQTFEHATLKGDAFYFFANGKLNKHFVYLGYVKDLPYSMKIIDCVDSTGKVLVAEGNGHYMSYDEKNELTEEGDVKDGVKNGVWKQNFDKKSDLRSATEIYDKGRFVSGTSTDKNGKTIEYTTLDVEPTFKGGTQAFLAYLSSNIHYPKFSWENRIQGKVFVQFVVESNGTLSDVKATRAPNDELGAEAVRAVKASPPWQPGYQYGRPVRVQYTVPVSFTFTR